jgi:hypothetical protein
VHDIPIPPRWFCRRTPWAPPEGPFDLQQLAALLHTRDITSATLTQRENEQPWIAFGDRPEFAEALKTPEAEIAQHLRDLAAQEIAPWWSPRRLYYLGAFIVGILMEGGRNRNRWPYSDR